jgi:hypothetical protein
MRALSGAAVLVVVAVSLSGCNCGDGNGGGDAGPGEDAGGHDAGLTSDAGLDAGLPDSGTLDAGTTDAGLPDAGAPDAGPGVDDAGCPLPTGLVLDAQDAGLPASGLRLWLRADTALAVVDGGAVCRWEDVSGNGQHFVPGTATPPWLSPAGLRGHPAVSFPGPSRHLTRSGVLGISATAGRTIAVIGLTQDTVRRFQYLIMGHAGSAGTYFSTDMNAFNTSGSKEGVYVTNNAYDADLATAAEVRTHVFSISSFAPGGDLPGVVQYSVSGTLRTLTRTPGGLGNGTVEDFSSADFTSVGLGTSGFTGALVGDVLVYDRALSATERTAVEAYLQARYP